MSVAIMTDTNSGISPEEGEQYGICVVSMPIIIDDEEFFEYENITGETLFNEMNRAKEVRSSQPSIGYVLEMWEKLLNDYDEVVYIPMSSGLSGSYDTANGFAADFNNRVYVADSHRISVTLYEAVFDALQMSRKGYSDPWTGVWSGDYMVDERYNPESKEHKNLVIAESLSVIENVLLFSISNYFRKFSMEYKAVHQVENFDNDWYEYVEYGTTNPTTIFLQQNGFSREASIYIQTPSNYSKYMTEVDGEKKIKRSILECGNIGVETEAQDIQFNIPELFVE